MWLTRSCFVTAMVLKMAQIYLLVALAALFCVATPLPAIVAFRAAWHPEFCCERTILRKLLLLVPTTIFPVVVLSLHASAPSLHWKDSGESYFNYLARGSASWIYFPPFAMANFLIGRTVVDTEYAHKTLLTPISLVTCILICAFFTLGNLKGAWLFPLSAGCGYFYGLQTLIQRRGLPRITARHVWLIVGWLMTMAATVTIGAARTKQIVSELPDEPPGCFIVTAACRGHQTVVQSTVDTTTGQLTNDQLAVFRTFERWLQERKPVVHKVARQVYNRVAPPIARAIRFRWQADCVYLMLKPFEWLIRLTIGR